MIASPYPTLNPLRLSTPSPTRASATAAQVIGPILWRSSKAANSGVQTTYSPVMNPETLAGGVREAGGLQDLRQPVEHAEDDSGAQRFCGESLPSARGATISTATLATANRSAR